MTDSHTITIEQWQYSIFGNANNYCDICKVLFPDTLYWNYQTKTYKEYVYWLDASKQYDKYPKLMRLIMHTDCDYTFAKYAWENELAKAMARAKKRMAIINRCDAFLEHYMRCQMHPDRIAKALIENPELDVDEYMTAYVATL